MTSSAATSKKAFWFVALFLSASALFAAVDAQLADLPDVRAFGRCIGPLSALLASSISLVLGTRFRQMRFFLVAIPSALMMVYWFWKFYAEAHGRYD